MSMAPLFIWKRREHVRVGDNLYRLNDPHRNEGRAKKDYKEKKKTTEQGKGSNVKRKTKPRFALFVCTRQPRPDTFTAKTTRHTTSVTKKKNEKRTCAHMTKSSCHDKYHHIE